MIKQSNVQKQFHTNLLVCLWCWMIMFFSWMVSSKAVARDFRSVIDWGVAGKLHPLSSDNKPCTAIIRNKAVNKSTRVNALIWHAEQQHFFTSLFSSLSFQEKSNHTTWAPCLGDRTPERALLLDLPPISGFLLRSRAVYKKSRKTAIMQIRWNITI